MSRYAPRRPGDVARAIDDEVLAILTTHDDAGYIATPLPLLATVDEAGSVTELIGHFALSNPHVERVRRTPAAQVTFLGPHGYVAPAMVSRCGWAPSWNYRFVQMEVDIELRPEENDAAIRALVARMEGVGADRWSIDVVGARYAAMIRHVVAFRARVRRVHARFKLGQDEDPQSFAEIVAALGDAPLAAAMTDQARDDGGEGA
ncbi:MAG: FMN-binding negative transcriptional regulator [Sphingomonas taxi]|uniref:FMN-binding negative transcriptional regulator n=1 Tax=Sphingomonas taxi TaxID=1549858 RepID=A0A2W5P3Q6_9SPHN|nr:MAG: FMN-binding negative transcriptional regulator [Sphingomonas taxi]